MTRASTAYYDDNSGALASASSNVLRQGYDPVALPALGRVGVSRKIEDDQVRRTLRDTLLELAPPKGLGFIIRTAGVERTRRDLGREQAVQQQVAACGG